MRWLITGAAGMLGQELVRRLAGYEEDVVALGHDQLDITRPAAVRAAVAEHRPGIVVNCAAHTAVDDAETNEAAAALLNAEAPRLLAETCAIHGARLVHLSTDYVFPGDARTPYVEDHPTAPAARTDAPNGTASKGYWTRCPPPPCCAPPGSTGAPATASSAQ